MGCIAWRALPYYSYSGTGNAKQMLGSEVASPNARSALVPENL